MEKEKRNKEREAMINDFLVIQAKIARLGNTVDRQSQLSSLQAKLLGVANEHKHTGFKEELDNLRHSQIELTKLQIELERLEGQQQSQIQIPPK